MAWGQLSQKMRQFNKTVDADPRIRTNFRISRRLDHMGTNRRYGEAGSEKAVEELLVRAMPVSLTDEELDLEHHPIHRPAEPRRVRAWIRFHEATIRPRVRAIAWTDRAVQVEWAGHGGVLRTTWVWADAIEDGWDLPPVDPRR
jgi:hypothetical protein